MDRGPTKSTKHFGECPAAQTKPSGLHPFLGFSTNSVLTTKTIPEIWKWEEPHPPVVEDVVRLLLLDTLVVLELVLRLVLLVLLLVPDVDVLVALVEDVTWQVRNFEIPRSEFRRKNMEKRPCFLVCRLVKWIVSQQDIIYRNLVTCIQ